MPKKRGWSKEPARHSLAAMGVKTKSFPRPVKRIVVTARTKDMFMASFLDNKGKEMGEYNEYVPEFMPECTGDEFTIDIDVDTGKILNWKKPKPSDIDEAMEECGDEESDEDYDED